MKSKITLSLFLLLWSVTSLFANGGVTVYSWTKGSANPVFRNIEEVSIISEKMEVKIEKGRSIVSVQYLLRNNSDKDFTKADYAFPVDYFEGVEESLPGGTRSVAGWNESYIKDVSFGQNQKELPWLSSDTIVTLKDEYFAGYSQGHTLNRRWFYTQIDLPKHAITTLEVKYSIKNYGSMDGYSPDFFWEMDDRIAYRFSYDFSPAKHWHDGTVGYFSMKIDASNLNLNLDDDYFDSEMLTLNYPLKDLGNNIYTFEADNFDLNTAQAIDFIYTVKTYDFVDILQRKYIPVDQYSLSASSNMSKYPVTHLNDLNLETAWVAKDGEGAWIDIVFADTIKMVGEYTDGLSAIVIANGYHKNEKTYEENSTIKRLELIINQDDKNNEGESFDEPATIYLDLERKPYQKIYLKDLFDSKKVDVHDFFDDPIDWRHGIKRIRLKILEVDKGSKYDDLCVSEILILK